MKKKENNDSFFNGFFSDGNFADGKDGWSSDGWFSDEKTDLSIDELEGIAGGFQQETTIPSIKDKIVPGPTGGCQDSNTGEENGEKNKSGFLVGI